MRLSFAASVKETENTQGIWLNTITVRLKDGREVVLDRDQTDYSSLRVVEYQQAYFDVEWSGVYVWDGENMDYSISADMFRDCVLVDYMIEEDADDEYVFKIMPKTLAFFD